RDQSDLARIFFDVIDDERSGVFRYRFQSFEILGPGELMRPLVICFTSDGYRYLSPSRHVQQFAGNTRALRRIAVGDRDADRIEPVVAENESQGPGIID